MKINALPVLLLIASTPAFGGRPLGTDDAGTVGDKSCQLESWREHGKTSRGWVVSPACGLGEFELGIEASRSKLPEEQSETAQTMALKWGPELLNFGALSFGGKVWTGRSRLSPAAEDERATYRPAENGGLLLASWAIQDSLQMHLNLGMARDRLERQDKRLANLALAWRPHERLTLFGEALYRQREGSTQAGGLRIWAIPDTLGIDLTASRVAGMKNSGAYSIGFGWYGIFGK